MKKIRYTFPVIFEVDFMEIKDDDTFTVPYTGRELRMFESAMAKQVIKISNLLGKPAYFIVEDPIVEVVHSG